MLEGGSCESAPLGGSACPTGLWSTARVYFDPPTHLPPTLWVHERRNGYESAPDQ